MDQIAKASPRLKARIAGGLYLIVIGAGLYAEFFVRSKLIVRGDAAATAGAIHASELLFRSSIAADLVGVAGYIGVTAILYRLLEPVSRTVSLLAAFFSLVGCAILAAILVNLVAPLILLGGAPYLAAFRPDQLQALALTSLRLHGQGYNIAMIFFGFYCLTLGYLIFRSTFLPRILGVLLAIAGLSDLTDSFATVVWPAFESHLGLYIMLPALVGEASLCLWLLAIGVNAPRWEARAAAYGRRR